MHALSGKCQHRKALVDSVWMAHRFNVNADPAFALVGLRNRPRHSISVVMRYAANDGMMPTGHNGSRDAPIPTSHCRSPAPQAPGVLDTVKGCKKI